MASIQCPRERDNDLQRHVEIAGGGIAGLNAAIVLSRQGWSVRVHERAPEIRESGAGIFLRKNSIDILEAIGAFSELAPQGVKIRKARIADRDGRIRQEFDVTPSRLYCVPRQALVDALSQTARRTGVEINLSSTAVAAEEDGVLILDNGKRLRADLVIAADGFNSAVRKTIMPEARSWELSAAVNRHFVPTREIAREPFTTQHWSGQRRIGITPTSPTHTYVYMVCHSADASGRVLPLDVDNWTRAFPALQRDLEIIAEAPVTQYRYHMVECPRWYRGRVVIVGDAAHGLPPTLGQGAGLAIMNAYAMAQFLNESVDVPAALYQWERKVRFVSDLTQKWSCRYDWFTRQWPTSLEFVRPLIFWAFRRLPYLNDRMRVAERGLQPLGFAIA
jgi:2-polyprenyl-6-methoxyphenol hydroxylase-like FAD-dependent oxidoreductase